MKMWEPISTVVVARVLQVVVGTLAVGTLGSPVSGRVPPGLVGNHRIVHMGCILKDKNKPYLRKNQYMGMGV